MAAPEQDVYWSRSCVTVSLPRGNSPGQWEAGWRARFGLGEAATTTERLARSCRKSVRRVGGGYRSHAAGKELLDGGSDWA
jgi:hypothetical protein